jgi:hypothetical protein
MLPHHFRFGDIYMEKKKQIYMSECPTLKNVSNFAVDGIKIRWVGEITTKATFQYGSTHLLTCLRESCYSNKW